MTRGITLDLDMHQYPIFFPFPIVYFHHLIRIPRIRLLIRFRRHLRQFLIQEIESPPKIVDKLRIRKYKSQGIVEHLFKDHLPKYITLSLLHKNVLPINTPIPIDYSHAETQVFRPFTSTHYP